MPLPDFISQPWRKIGIKSGSGLGTRLLHLCILILSHCLVSHELATPTIPSHFPPHCSTPYTTPAITATRHSVYNELKISTYPCYIAPQTPACTFDALTSSPGIFYETLMHHATRSGSPRNALHSPSYYFWRSSFRILGFAIQKNFIWQTIPNITFRSTRQVLISERALSFSKSP